MLFKPFTCYIVGIVTTAAAVSAGHGHSGLTCFGLGILSTLALLSWQAGFAARLFTRISAPPVRSRKVRSSRRFRPGPVRLPEDDQVAAQFGRYQKIPPHKRMKLERAALANAVDAKREALLNRMPDSDWAAMKPAEMDDFPNA